MLHPDEWLREAKKLAIGRSARVYHGAEHRPNLVVRNLPDRYTCYCHRCHDGGVVMKEYVKVQPVVQRDSTLELPNDAVPLNPDAPNAHLSKVVGLLHSKGLSFPVVAKYNPRFSPSANRLLLDVPGQTIGRSLGTSTAKWVRYNAQCSYVAPRGVKVHGGRFFLCEDAFSALKAAFYLPDGWYPIAMLGTELNKDLLHLVLSSDLVVLAFDNDDAGVAGSIKAARKLRLLGTAFKYAWCSVGCDPKNESAQWFIEAVNA